MKKSDAGFLVSAMPCALSSPAAMPVVPGIYSGSSSFHMAILHWGRGWIRWPFKFSPWPRLLRAAEEVLISLFWCWTFSTKIKLMSPFIKLSLYLSTREPTPIFILFPFRTEHILCSVAELRLYYSHKSISQIEFIRLLLLLNSRIAFAAKLSVTHQAETQCHRYSASLSAVAQISFIIPFYLWGNGNKETWTRLPS